MPRNIDQPESSTLSAMRVSLIADADTSSTVILRAPIYLHGIGSPSTEFTASILMVCCGGFALTTNRNKPPAARRALRDLAQHGRLHERYFSRQALAIWSVSGLVR